MGWRMVKSYAENTENMSEVHQAYRQQDIDYQYIPCIFRKMVWLQPVQLPLHCWRWITRRTSGKFSSAWNSDLFTHVFTRVLSSQHRWCPSYIIYDHSCINCLFARSLLVLHEQTGCIAANKLVWTVVILNGSETSGPVTSDRALAGRYIIFLRQKGGSSEPPRTPPPHPRLRAW